MGVDSEAQGSENSKWVVSRRNLLKASGLSLMGLGLSQLSCALPAGGGKRLARFGIVTDCHYADADIKGSRHYRQSLDKLAECVDLMNSERSRFFQEQVANFIGYFTAPPIRESFEVVLLDLS